MFVSVRRYTHVQSLASLVREIELDFVPRLRRMPGFIAYYAVDSANGTLTTISVFSTPAMAEDSNAQAAAWMRDKFPQNTPAPDDIISGRLSVVVPAIHG